MKLPLKHPGVAVTLAVAYSLVALSTDLIVVSLPGMARYFGAGVPAVQAAISILVAGYGVSQLFYGPLSDRFGRRPTLLFGGALYWFATLACLFAPSIEVLLAARLVQGIGCCAFAVVGRAIVRDVHGAEGTARMMGYISAIMSVLIFLGPIVGGLLEQAFGWRANFAALALIGAAVFTAAGLYLAESNIDRRAVDVGATFASYGVMLRDRRFAGYTLCMALTHGVIMAFLSDSSFLLINVLGMSASRFGLLFGLSILGFVLGSFITARLVMRVGLNRLLHAGALLAAISGTIMAVFALLEVRSVLAIFGPYFALMLANGFIQPSATAGAIGPFPRMAGTASSLLGFIQLATGATVGFLVGRLHDGTPLPMTIAIGVCACGVCLVYYSLIRPVAERVH